MLDDKILPMLSSPKFVIFLSPVFSTNVITSSHFLKYLKLGFGNSVATPAYLTTIVLIYFVIFSGYEKT